MGRPEAPSGGDRHLRVVLYGLGAAAEPQPMTGLPRMTRSSIRTVGLTRCHPTVSRAINEFAKYVHVSQSSKLIDRIQQRVIGAADGRCLPLASRSRSLHRFIVSH